MFLLRRFPTSVRAVFLGLTCFGSLPAAQAVVSYPPNDEHIVYSDYACAHVDALRAGFDRPLPGTWVCHQEEMSPGVRATFLVDASQMRLELDYRFAGFYCGAEEHVRLSWEFALVVDGVRRPTGPRNPLYPLAQGSTPWIPLGATPGPHLVTLVWPSASDVDLRRVFLRNIQPDSTPALLPLPPRAQPLLTVFGDSITHGLAATNVMNTYPVRLAALKGWRVTNLGFSGRNTQPEDARLAAGISPCPDGETATPDLLLLEIGSNDFHLVGPLFTRIEKFDQNYRLWLERFRSLRPTTPILCVTPLPRGDECRIKERNLEDYRERIRMIVAERADPAIYLFEGRDLIALPPEVGDPLYDDLLLHPTDLGFEQITDRLSRFNLVRNPGFELRPLANCREVVDPEPYLWSDVGSGLSQVSEETGARALALAPSGARSQLVYGLSEGDDCTLSANGVATLAGHLGRITLEFLDAGDVPVGDPLVLSFTQDVWRPLTRRAKVPVGAIRGRLTLAKGAGPGRFLVDDLELTVQAF